MLYLMVVYLLPLNIHIIYYAMGLILLFHHG